MDYGDEQAWCECGHEMELVRPGKHQKVGCCERIAELEAENKRLREALIENGATKRMDWKNYWKEGIGNE